MKCSSARGLSIPVSSKTELGSRRETLGFLFEQILLGAVRGAPSSCFTPLNVRVSVELCATKPRRGVAVPGEPPNLARMQAQACFVFFIFLGRCVSALSQICLYHAAPINKLLLDLDARPVAAADTISRAADVAGWGGFGDGYKCALIALLLRRMQICRSLAGLPGADLLLWDGSRQGTAWVGPTGTSVCPRARCGCC